MLVHNQGHTRQQAQQQEANAEAVLKVRAGTKAVFEALVPALEIDISCADPEALGESGARFAVRNAQPAGDASGDEKSWTGCSLATDDLDDEVDCSSGAQQVLLPITTRLQ